MSLHDESTQVEAQSKATSISLPGTVGAIEGFTDLQQVFLCYTLSVIFNLLMGKIFTQVDPHEHWIAFAMAYCVVDQIGN